MAKDTTDSVKSFSTFFLKEYGKLEVDCLSFGNSVIWSCNGAETGRINYDISTIEGDSYVHLKYRTKPYWEEEWISIDYKVPLEAVRCHFGGIRWYFRCTLTKNGYHCGRRVAILYKTGNYFGCRYCAELTYTSCLESKRMRGYPWKILSDSWKADELVAEVKVKYYNGKPTRKYRRCLRLWSADKYVLEAEKALFDEL